MIENINDYFPWSDQIKEFRKYQEEILNKITTSFNNGTEVIILEAPTGFGKSPVNIALGKYYKPAFYTTPQKKLVNQIANQFGPKKLAIDFNGPEFYDCVPLLGRNTYTCRCTNTNSSHCGIYNDGKIKNPEATDSTNKYIKAKCSSQDCCTYWKQKKACMGADIAIITFAMLIINSYIKKNPDSVERVKFNKRNLLIIDECGNLVNQVASMFCGFKITPKIFPLMYRDAIWKIIEEMIPINKSLNDYIEFFDDLIIELKTFIRKNKDLKKREIQKFESLFSKIEYMKKEIDEEDRTWVVNVIDEKKKYIEFKPIKIDRFLNEKVWSQTEKIILSSATIPFRGNIKKWLRILGLQNKKYEFFSVPTTFPVENRPIITSYIGGGMTSKQEIFSWDTNIEMIKQIINENINERGVIHCVSYERGRKIYKELRLAGFDVFFHDNKNKIGYDKNIIDVWINSRRKILISPAIMEGVDLKDDLCRYQILFKVPYLSIGDERTKYLLNIEKQWDWYYGEAISNILQMYGRGVRHKEDYCKFYIVDKNFKDLIRRKKENFPDYFLEAIDYYKAKFASEQWIKDTFC